MSLRSASYPGMGLVDNRAIGAAKEDSAAFWIWVRRCSGQSHTQTLTGGAVQGFEEQTDRFPRSEWAGCLARGLSGQVDCLIPAGKAASAERRHSGRSESPAH